MQSDWQREKQQALQLARTNKVSDALARCRELHRQVPDDAELLEALVLLSGQTGAFAAGESYARELVRLYPSTARSHALLARMLQAQNRVEEAVTCLQATLGRKPDDASSWLVLAGLQWQLGQKTAGQSYAKAIELAPGNPVAWHDRGAWLQAQGELDEAIASYHEAVRLAPGAARMHASLGAGFFARRELDKAAACYQEALRLAPEDRLARYELANVRYDLGDYARAAPLYQQVLQQEPEHEGALLALGLSLQALSRLDEAITCYQQLAELAPGDADNQARIGLLCLETGRSAKALEAFTQASRLVPENAVHRLHIGIALEHLGRFDEAVAHLRAMLEDGYSDEVDVAGVLASLYERLGERDKAWELATCFLATPVMQNGRVRVNSLGTALRLCHHHQACDAVIEQVGRLLENGQMSDEERRNLSFALGMRHDKLGNYDAAFAAFAHGNRLKNVAYSEAADIGYIDTLERCFREIDFDRLVRNGSCHSDLPVFIIGMPRSGTSLVEQILSCHPAVHAAGELEEFQYQINRLRTASSGTKKYPDGIAALTAADLDQLASGYLESIRARAPDAARVTDKMPHNFTYLGLIRLGFPRVAIIHCVRNPLDTCLSCYFQDFSGFHNYAYDLDHLAGHYLQYQRLMQFWKEDLRIDMHEVCYEDLVDDPEPQVRALLQHCGLDWHDACLDFYRSERNVRTASYDQVRQPLYRTSRERWRNYESHIGPLIRRLGDIAAPGTAPGVPARGPGAGSG